jgi:hypothetical protein
VSGVVSSVSFSCVSICILSTDCVSMYILIIYRYIINILYTYDILYIVYCTNILIIYYTNILIIYYTNILHTYNILYIDCILIIDYIYRV